MGHETHKAGTAQGCTECAQLAYEPSWYATLLTRVIGGELLIDTSEEQKEQVAVPV